MWIARIVEELFPFAYYVGNASKLRKRSHLPNVLDAESLREYVCLSVAVLDRRLAEEHDRAAALDEKTLRVTFFVSAAFAVLGIGLTVIGNSSWAQPPESSSVFDSSWLIAPRSAWVSSTQSSPP